MKFSAPSNIKAPELLLHIWKIIDIPTISETDLIFKISFEFFFLPPEKAKIFVKKAIQSKFLIIDDNGLVQISEKIKNQLENWQKDRKKKILSNIKKKKK